jgi:SAM-dependent methyltransferase
MNFGVLHLPLPERAFAEAARVLRAGGRYAFTVWAGEDESPGAAIVQQAVAAHGRPDVELPTGPDHLRHGRRRDWQQLLGQCGFAPESVTVDRVTAEWDVPTDFSCSKPSGTPVSARPRFLRRRRLKRRGDRAPDDAVGAGVRD